LSNGPTNIFAAKSWQGDFAPAHGSATAFWFGRVTVGSQLAGAVWARASTLTYSHVLVSANREALVAALTVARQPEFLAPTP